MVLFDLMPISFGDLLTNGVVLKERSQPTDPLQIVEGTSLYYGPFSNLRQTEKLLTRIRDINRLETPLCLSAEEAIYVDRYDPNSPEPIYFISFEWSLEKELKGEDHFEETTGITYRLSKQIVPIDIRESDILKKLKDLIVTLCIFYQKELGKRSLQSFYGYGQQILFLDFHLQSSHPSEKTFFYFNPLPPIEEQKLILTYLPLDQGSIVQELKDRDLGLLASRFQVEVRVPVTKAKRHARSPYLTNSTASSFKQIQATKGVTHSGFDLKEAHSILRHYVRRGETTVAVQIAFEIYQFSTLPNTKRIVDTLFTTLETIALEDVGIANPKALSYVVDQLIIHPEYRSKETLYESVLRLTNSQKSLILFDYNQTPEKDLADFRKPSDPIETIDGLWLSGDPLEIQENGNIIYHYMLQNKRKKVFDWINYFLRISRGKPVMKRGRRTKAVIILWELLTLWQVEKNARVFEKTIELLKEAYFMKEDQNYIFLGFIFALWTIVKPEKIASLPHLDRPPVCQTSFDKEKLFNFELDVLDKGRIRREFSEDPEMNESPLHAWQTSPSHPKSKDCDEK